MMEVFQGIDTKDMLFLDIETVRCVNDISEHKGTQLFDSFEYKTRYARETVEKFGIEDLGELWKEKAALWSEFSKIVCITLGYITPENMIRLKSYCSHDEQKLLTDFMLDINRFYRNNPKIKIVGHAISGFDVPTIMRRCIVNKVHMNTLFDCSNKKPWEVPLIDTLLAWKATGYYSASLLNVATALGIESPKSDIDGSQVSDVYWKEDDIERIQKYCERDVVCNINVVRAMRYERTIKYEPEVLREIEISTIPVLSKIYIKEKMDPEDVEELLASMKEAKLNKEEKEKILTIVKAAVKGGRINKDIQKKILA